MCLFAYFIFLYNISQFIGLLLYVNTYIAHIIYINIEKLHLFK